MAVKPRILVDLNIILDVLANREPFYTASSKVWTTVEAGHVQGFIAAHSVTTLFYLLSRHASHERAQTALLDLLRVFSVATVDQSVIISALALGWRDFEDAVQMAAAAQANVDYLITRNTKDFRAGPIPVLQPADFLVLMQIPTGV